MKARGRLADEAGMSLVETLIVMVILVIVLGALTQLFVSAMRTEVDQTMRFQAQQEGRVALDGLRREIHCANAVSSTQTGGGWPSSAIKITLGSYCGTGSGDVTWCTSGSSSRYALRRVTPALAVGAACTGGIQMADYLTLGPVFTGLTTGVGLRTKLGIRLPVDASSTTTGGLYELQDDIVLRNTARGT